MPGKRRIETQSEGFDWGGHLPLSEAEADLVNTQKCCRYIGEARGWRVIPAPRIPHCSLFRQLIALLKPLAVHVMYNKKARLAAGQIVSSSDYGPK
jgi:hypothetical protein